MSHLPVTELVTGDRDNLLRMLLVMLQKGVAKEDFLASNVRIRMKILTALLTESDILALVTKALHNFDKLRLQLGVLLGNRSVFDL